MKRVRALDYSLPQECDKGAADLMKELLVKIYPVICLTRTFVMKAYNRFWTPVERLGVPPKSSSEELRQHSFFCGD